MVAIRHSHQEFKREKDVNDIHEQYQTNLSNLYIYS